MFPHAPRFLQRISYIILTVHNLERELSLLTWELKITLLSLRLSSNINQSFHIHLTYSFAFDQCFWVYICSFTPQTFSQNLLCVARFRLSLLNRAMLSVLLPLESFSRPSPWSLHRVIWGLCCSSPAPPTMQHCLEFGIFVNSIRPE